MPNVLVRDLPDEVHRALLERAEQAGQSLQQYLTVQLTGLVATTTPRMDQVLARVAGRSGGSIGFESAVADLIEGRARE